MSVKSSGVGTRDYRACALARSALSRSLQLWPTVRRLFPCYGYRLNVPRFARCGWCNPTIRCTRLRCRASRGGRQAQSPGALSLYSHVPHFIMTQSLFLSVQLVECKRVRYEMGKIDNNTTKGRRAKEAVLYDGGAPPWDLSFSFTNSWNSSLRIASLRSRSSCCSFKIPRFSSALITWFSFRIRTAFIRR